MKSQSENPKGLHRRYVISKVNGEPVDPLAEYFVLRLDCRSEDWHRFASREAIHAYADAIEQVEPKLASDLREQYPRETVSLSMNKARGPRAKTKSKT